MAYQVLARKWRPSNFTQLVGQEHVSQSLIHALRHDRLHHAYLFTGTRGVGKTTVARILAKAINCENLIDCNPCGACEVCLAFEQGRFMDLIEVDAASRTKVEDTRDLLDNAQYAPNQGRYKVYLIDEVHMLSGHSFNALLKTLEEPPAHVKFLLATTDPHKIPVTVLSRCLQFNLKRLLPDQIARQLQYILEQEAISFDTSSLKLLARAADGSLRDALSLLDQAIAFGGGSIDIDTVTTMLGCVAQQPIDDILQALALGNASTLMAKIAEIAEFSPDFPEILQQILQVFHRVALTQQLPDFVDHDYDKNLLDNLASTLSAEEVQLFYQICLIGQRDLELAPDPRSGFEMLMLRMLTFKPQKLEHEFKPPAKPVVMSSPSLLAPTSPSITAVSSNTNEVVQQIPKSKEWSEIIKALNLTGRAKELVNNCVLESIDEHSCKLLLDPNFQQIGSKAEDKLRIALQQYFNKPLKLTIITHNTTLMTPALEMQKEKHDKQQAAVDSINSDENILALKETFDARIISGSIEPLT